MPTEARLPTLGRHQANCTELSRGFTCALYERLVALRVSGHSRLSPNDTPLQPTEAHRSHCTHCPHRPHRPNCFVLQRASPGGGAAKQVTDISYCRAYCGTSYQLLRFLSHPRETEENREECERQLCTVSTRVHRLVFVTVATKALPFSSFDLPMTTHRSDGVFVPHSNWRWGPWPIWEPSLQG